MNDFNITGTIINICPINIVSYDKQFHAFWIKSNHDSPQYVRLQLLGLSCLELANCKIGDRVECDFVIAGKPKNDKNGKEVLYNNFNVTNFIKL